MLEILLDPVVVAAVCVAFVFGVAVGLALSEGWELARGRHYGLVISLLSALRDRVPRGRRVLVVGLIGIMLGNAALAGLLVVTRIQADEERARSDAFVDCVASYFRADATARDARVADQRAARAELRRTLLAEQGVDSTVAVVRYLDRLDRELARTPYPSPDRCRRLSTVED